MSCHFFAVGLNDHCRIFTTELLYSTLTFLQSPPSQLTHHPPLHLSFGCSLLHMLVDASRQHMQPCQHLCWLPNCSGLCPLTPSPNAQPLPTSPSPLHLSHQSHMPPCLECTSTYDSTHNARKPIPWQKQRLLGPYIPAELLVSPLWPSKDSHYPRALPT